MRHFLGLAGHRVVPCGSRHKAYDKFQNACRFSPEAINILLVDSEDAVSGLPHLHLSKHDKWKFTAAQAGRVHLMMAQTMEAWIVADPEALKEYYGKGFQEKALPKSTDLEQVSKKQINDSLARATKNTAKRSYHKIRDGGRLLKQIRSDEVRRRCRHCDSLFQALAAQIR